MVCYIKELFYKVVVIKLLFVDYIVIITIAKEKIKREIEKQIKI